MAACVGQLASVLEELDVHDAHLIGYSMGGRVALAFCVAHPARVASALLVGASAGIRDPQQRMDRVRDDEALAERIEREGVEAFVEFWISQAFLVDARRLGARGVAEGPRRANVPGAAERAGRNRARGRALGSHRQSRGVSGIGTSLSRRSESPEEDAAFRRRSGTPNPTEDDMNQPRTT